MHKQKITSIIFFVVFTCMFAFLFYFFFLKKSESIIFVEKSTKIIGKIYGYNKARTPKFYIGKSNVAYNFSGYENQEVNGFRGLVDYLDYNDSIVKNYNSDSIILIRNSKKSVWRFSK